eukprot:TRINITY_DN63137_c0_g1_i1.p1 TRINITY_DN63137_c0_g1~~TRINITY_DN63137_c0_g1_i1.p1  ORF type:complete len:529 (-),score=80.21 TRINITY_DN63137_c0_g1_i1:183-1769(-)
MADDGGFSLIGAIIGTCSCASPLMCTLTLDRYGFLLWIAIACYMFHCLGIVCDNYFGEAIETIVKKLKLSNDVAGATFMAMGSSAPELCISFVTCVLILNTGGVGAIIGSAVFNMFFVTGLVGLTVGTKNPLTIERYPFIRDSIFYASAIALLWVTLDDGKVELTETLYLLGGYVVLCVYMAINSRLVKFVVGQLHSFGLITLHGDSDSEDEEALEWKTLESAEEKPRPAIEGSPKDDAPLALPAVPEDKLAVPGVPSSAVTDVGSDSVARPTSASVAVIARPVSSSSSRGARPTSAAKSTSSSGSGRRSKLRPASGSSEKSRESPKAGAADGEAEPTAASLRRKAAFDFWWLRDPISFLWEITMPDPEINFMSVFAVSVICIGLCTFVMVDAVMRLGCNFSVPGFLIFVLMVAPGTSVPDTISSVAAAKEGEGNMAIGNIMGSNCFDVFVGLGFPWLLRCLIYGSVDYGDARRDELMEGVYVLVAATSIFVIVMVANKFHLDSSTGKIFLFFYAAYAVYFVMRAILR